MTVTQAVWMGVIKVMLTNAVGEGGITVTVTQAVWMGVIKVMLT